MGTRRIELPPPQVVAANLAGMPDERERRAWLYTRILKDSDLIERQLKPKRDGGAGLTNKQVAAAYGISLGSFSGTLCKVRKALGVRRNADARSTDSRREAPALNIDTSKIAKRDRHKETTREFVGGFGEPPPFPTHEI